jgi:hypothetical protein
MLVDPTSYIWQMLGWLNAAMVRASCLNRAVNSALETFRATSRSNRVSRAFHTSPIPPSPSFETKLVSVAELVAGLEVHLKPLRASLQYTKTRWPLTQNGALDQGNERPAFRKLCDFPNQAGRHFLCTSVLRCPVVWTPLSKQADAP